MLSQILHPMTFVYKSLLKSQFIKLIIDKVLPREKKILHLTKSQTWRPVAPERETNIFSEGKVGGLEGGWDELDFKTFRIQVRTSSGSNDPPKDYYTQPVMSCLTRTQMALLLNWIRVKKKKTFRKKNWLFNSAKVGLCRTFLSSMTLTHSSWVVSDDEVGVPFGGTNWWALSRWSTLTRNDLTGQN